MQTPPRNARTFDAVVVGCGGMGSAALCALARRGVRVLGIEQFDIGHAQGSSGLGPRIYRFAQFLDPAYVPLMQHAFEHWSRLERDAGEQLLFRTGGLDIGRPESGLVAGSKAACALHGIAHEVLTAAELRRRFPAWQPPDGFEAVYQADSGIVGAERAIYAHLAVADRHGAELWARTRVTEMSETSAGVVIETSRGRVEAGAAIITAGPWAGDMLPALHPHLTPERQVVGWFQPRPPERFVRGAFPVFIVEDETGNYYGFPIHDRPGVKLARHGHQNEATTPDTMRRTIDAEDEAVLSRFTRRWFGDGLGQALSLATCLYTNTPDNHFVIDSAPGTRNTWVAAGFSGHGYKFCAGVGEILADLATTATTRAPVHLFRASRFAAPQRV